MFIRSLRVENVRSHHDFSRQLSAQTTVVTGDNGSGKTTLLEAIMIALEGRSFKGTDSELLRQGAEWWRIDLVCDGQERTVKYQPRKSAKQKEFVINDKATARLPQAERYPVVLFEPEDLRLLHGSPARRRDYIDRLAAKLYPGYSRIISRYEKNLAQRNKLLKNNASSHDLFAWNVGLAKYGAHIIQTRTNLVRRLQQKIQTVYETIADTNDKAMITYSHEAATHSEQALLSELEHQTQRDMILGFTSVGPHRHDIVFYLNDTPATQVASRGEVRTMVLAVKFIEVDLIEEIVEKKPIILLDDVFSELDKNRQAHLVTNFKNHQIIMTSVNAPSSLSRAGTIRLR